MAALGRDIGGIEDVDPFLTLVDGGQAAAQRVLVSLQHSPGVLWWAPERGYNLWAHIHGFFEQERLERRVQTEAEADEAVERVRVSISVLGNEAQVKIQLRLNDGTEATLEVTINQLGEVLNASIS